MSSVSGASVQSSTDVLTGGWSMVTGIQVQMLETQTGWQLASLQEICQEVGRPYLDWFGAWAQDCSLWEGRNWQEQDSVLVLEGWEDYEDYLHWDLYKGKKAVARTEEGLGDNRVLRPSKMNSQFSDLGHEVRPGPAERLTRGKVPGKYAGQVWLIVLWSG